MSRFSAFHIVTVGWPEDLGDAIAQGSGMRFSHISHPRYARQDFPGPTRHSEVHFLRDHLRQPMPESDHALLASLEQDGVPTVHNIILGDRVVSTLPYSEALRYATFMARRLIELFTELKPSVVIAGFDGVHAGISLAVARRMQIPWFGMNFSVIPPGLACFLDGMSPASRVHVVQRPAHEVRQLAEEILSRFEHGRIHVPAHITPPAMSFASSLKRLPGRLAAVLRTMRNSRLREYLHFTEDRTDVSVLAAVRQIRGASAARKALLKAAALKTPPPTPYIFFGLHTQPESSIDVWAPFFSNQSWVLELLSRALPVSHKLLVKIHKSDAANYSAEHLERMLSRPGIELVAPFADARAFIERSDLVVSIQGTMGLEAALLGKPVIMLGDSPVTMFPSASRIGEISELPRLIRQKLAQTRPDRSAIVDAYASYLSPFMPATHNDWMIAKTAGEIERLVEMFKRLVEYLRARDATPIHHAQ